MARRSSRLAVAGAALAVTTALAGCTADDGTTTDTTAAPTAPSSTGPPATGGTTATTPPADGTLTVQVFFMDENAFNVGRAPYVVPVEREVPADAPERAALEALFAGPTAEEAAGGLRFVASQATGIADVRIEDGTAHVQLAGGCSSGGSTFTIADHIGATLLQFTAVESVKIYDPAGLTEFPDEPGDSIPECLEP
jgi:hypothetical protein